MRVTSRQVAFSADLALPAPPPSARHACMTHLMLTSSTEPALMNVSVMWQNMPNWVGVDEELKSPFSYLSTGEVGGHTFGGQGFIASNVAGRRVRSIHKERDKSSTNCCCTGVYESQRWTGIRRLGLTRLYPGMEYPAPSILANGQRGKAREDESYFCVWFVKL